MITNHSDGTRRHYTEGDRPPFSYHMAASSSAKRARLRPAEEGATFWTQKNVDRDPPIFVSREEYSGQDAFFLAHIAKSRRHVAFGVADGVGGWEESGVNPAHFAHGLCRYMAENTLRPEKEQDLRPINLLTKGYDQVQEDPTIQAGGSTASLATADGSGYMEVANLGDSGFVVLSPGKVTFKSEPQTSDFNTPYQLSKLTAHMKKQFAIFGGGAPIQDHPGRSDITHHELNHGDVVIFGTDGLWDNLSHMEVLRIVSILMEKAGYWINGGSSVASVDSKKVRNLLHSSGVEEDMASRLAYAIMKEAKVASHDMKRDGPFAREVQRWFPNEDYHGGKVDDIAIIACIAIQDGEGHVKAKL
ncbi:protein serine/threonine phosphatase 2C [Myriangium duriaei CBS 260.36]|uniref:Protein phosphatase n=1 Tax=Myriangium duriaei CBS 260.36 TaxID=1168546 RepID=A0A9P4IZ11_9PEZI|nr:protein serine/threonine phosphatase 2C [Myriangium duriaei CBS 260.36]